MSPRYGTWSQPPRQSWSWVTNWPSTVSRVAAAAGVSKLLLYPYVSTKRDFYLAAVQIRRSRAQRGNPSRPGPSHGTTADKKTQLH